MDKKMDNKLMYYIEDDDKQNYLFNRFKLLGL